MEVPIKRREDASTRWEPASSRSWRPADEGSARSVLPAPESEAVCVNASAAPTTPRLSRCPAPPTYHLPSERLRFLDLPVVAVELQLEVPLPRLGARLAAANLADIAGGPAA
jgi:hypothetical protein